MQPLALVASFLLLALLIADPAEQPPEAPDASAAVSVETPPVRPAAYELPAPDAPLATEEDTPEADGPEDERR